MIKKHLIAKLFLFIEQLLPNCIWKPLSYAKYRLVGRSGMRSETSKAENRRKAEGFFDAYCKGRGIDIGYGGDLLCSNAKGWDMEHGDAQYMTGVPDIKYDFVYSSHTLEHMVEPSVALQNWWRVIKPNGYLMLYVPDRDLYERKQRLPSKWNPDHKHYFTLGVESPPDTINLVNLVSSSLKGFKIIYAKVCNNNYVDNGIESHAQGEYSLEMVIQKLV